MTREIASECQNKCEPEVEEEDRFSFDLLTRPPLAQSSFGFSLLLLPVPSVYGIVLTLHNENILYSVSCHFPFAKKTSKRKEPFPVKSLRFRHARLPNQHKQQKSTR